MHYVPEFHYFYDQPEPLLARAIQITAAHLAQFCTHYEAKLTLPNKGVAVIKKQGQLPTSLTEKTKIIAGLVQWITDNSKLPDLFCLRLYNEPKNPEECAIFDHGDDTCCWVLNISESQFNSLQDAWQKTGLPADLFYPENQTIVVPKPLGCFERAVTRLGFSFTSSHHYTPKRWAEKISLATIVIKPLSNKNIHAVIAMAQKIFNPSPEKANKYLNPADWSQKMRDGALLFSATVDTIPAGFVFAYPTEKNRLHIWLAGVLPEYRRLKIWSQLYQTIEAKAHELGYKKITLHTYPERFPHMFAFANKSDFNPYTPDKKIEVDKVYLQKYL